MLSPAGRDHAIQSRPLPLPSTSYYYCLSSQPAAVVGMAERALLFDLDGTLADSDGLHLRAFQDLLAAGDIHPAISSLCVP